VKSRTSLKGFSLIEIIIVITIIGILVAILIPSLYGLRMRAKKTKELNILKQVVQAWTMYSNDHLNEILPGYLDTNLQQHKELAWAFPNETLIPPAPTYDSDYLNISGPWPWRLLPYMNNEWKSLMFYTNSDWSDRGENVSEHGYEIAQKPAFGYNGFYLGGWQLYDSNANKPKTLFSDVRLQDNRSMNVVTKSLAQIQSSSNTIAFASTFLAEKRLYDSLPDDAPGTNFAIPSMFAGTRLWEILPNGHLKSNSDTYIPIGRYNRMPAIGFADGHVQNVEVHMLLNQKKWIPKAITVGDVPPEEFTHSQ